MTSLAGTGTLIRLILRRDRVTLAIWFLLSALAPVGIAASFASLYPTAEALQAYAAENMQVPAAVGMLGIIYEPTIGGLVAWRAASLEVVIMGIASILFVIRHTRTEEAAGRRELVGAGVVGRQAPLVAALAVVVGANLVIGVVVAATLIANGLAVPGSLAFGLSIAAGGVTFALVAGVTAQLAESQGAARGLALAAFGVTYLVRMIGDVAGMSWLPWLTPIGWVRLTRPVSGEQWWVLGLFLVLFLVLTLAALRLSAQRDLGAGIFPARPGPAEAEPGLNSPLALAWRLQQGSLTAWLIGTAAFGAILGSIGQSMGQFAQTPQIQEWLDSMGAIGGGDAFLFIIVYVLGQVASIYALMCTLELRSAETSGRAEALLATPVSRLRWASSHLVLSFAAPALMLATLGVALGLVYGLGSGEMARDLPRLFVRALATLPAVWVLVGLVTLTYGLLPRFTAAVSWGALGLFLLLELAFELHQVSQTVFDLSPFAHVHWASPLNATPMGLLTLLAGALTGAGLIAFQRREIGTA